MKLSKVEGAVGKIDKQLHLISKHLLHIKDAINLLILDKKILSDEGIVQQVVGSLNIRMVDFLLQKFKPDEIAPDPVPESVKQSVAANAKKHVGKLPLELDPMNIQFWPDI